MGGTPARTCVGCHRKRPQPELLRMTLGPGGDVIVAARGASGRGAYVCRDPACADRAVASGALKRGLRMNGPLPEDLGRRLLEVIEQGKR